VEWKLLKIAEAAACLFILISSSSSMALDWPQWGGLDRDHVSKEKGLLQEWPQGGPKRLWNSSTAGLGYSAVAVVEGKLFTMGARDSKEFLLAFNLEDGKELWATEIGPILRNGWGDGPRGTPAVSGEMVFALGGQGTLIAAKITDGKLQWKKNMQELGGQVPDWGYTESVLVEGENVYCTPGGKKGTLVALALGTGEVKWQSKDLTEEAQYASIVPATINGSRQLIQLTMSTLAGVHPKDGKLLWKSSWPGQTAVIPSPVVRAPYVYITSGYGVGCKMVKIGLGDRVQEFYQNKVMKNHHGGVVLIGDHLYGYSDGPGWTCQNFLTGDEVWSSRKLGKGAVAFADNRLYCLEEDSGTAVLAEASAEGWKEHGRLKLEPQSTQRSRSGKIWTHPVIANGKLYLRDQEMLFCFDIAQR
jgi:outer membrane protein assembly factor BamB